MDIQTWKSIVINKMGLVTPMTANEICQQHNGIQAQFPGYADFGFKSRLSSQEYDSGQWQKNLVRQWSLRGTVHAYLKEEIPLYLYQGRNYFKANLSSPSRNGLISASTKRYYAQLILSALEEGNLSRETLKEICRQDGLNKEDEKTLFNAWGGILASLVSEGLIYQEYGRRYFGRLESYQPLDKNTAELEIARRYFSGFGPVSLADARYYFKENKSVITGWMDQLDLNTIQVDGTERFYLGDLEEAEIPPVIFVAGFDALLLGFEKKQNPFFDSQYIRDIYTLTGIIKPTILLEGQLVATWRKQGTMIYIKPFKALNDKQKKLIKKEAEYHCEQVVYE